MKKIAYTAALAFVLCLSNQGWTQTASSGGDAFSQDDSTPPPPRPPRPDAPGQPGAAPTSEDALAQADAQLQRAKVDVQRAKAQSERLNSQMDQLVSTVTYLDGSGPGRAEHALVIRSSELDPKSLAAAEEDLNIMGRILEKAASQTGDGPEARAMGIPVYSIAGHSRMKNLQLEGYGAVFMLNVNFPLVGPAKVEESGSKEPSNSSWDEARRELYGQPAGAERNPNLDPFSNPYVTSDVREDYDPKRVEKLKDSLLEALKNAANMHSVKSDESVTVVVTSGGEGSFNGAVALFQRKMNAFAKAGGGSGGSGGGGSASSSEWHPHKNGGNGSTMTIRAKKSEIDAFASGKLNFEDFRNKAKVLVY